MTAFDPVNRMQRSAKTASGFGSAIFIIAAIVTSFLQTSCKDNHKNEVKNTNTYVIEDLKNVKVIPGTSKMNACPQDMFVDDTGAERACIIFPNDEISGNNRDYTLDYLKQVEASIWSKPNKAGNLFFFNDTTDERSFQERAKCPRLLSLAIWYEGDAEAVNLAIKDQTTNQFENKILAFSLIGNDCN